MLFIFSLFLACFEAQTTTTISQDEIATISVDPNIILPKRIKARHILISHKHAINAKSSLRRTREEAKTLAYDLFSQLQNGADFLEISKKFGNDPTAQGGGKLGVFSHHQMMPNFSNIAFQLKVHELGICETIFGYHILERLPLEEIVVRQLLVQWKDAHASTVSRTPTEAKERAEKAYQELLSGHDPITLIKKYSDGKMASRGGFLGFIEKEKTGSKLQNAAFSLRVGEHTPLIKSSSGYHILIREE